MPPTEQAQLSFITDDEIIRRVKQAENGVKHAETLLGSLRRELADLSRALEPGAETG